MKKKISVIFALVACLCLFASCGSTKNETYGGKTSEEATSSTLYSIYHFFSGTRPRLIVSTAVVLVAAIVGFKLLVVDTALVNYFPPDSKFRQDITYVDEHLAGSNTLYFIISGEELTEEEIAAKAVAEKQKDKRWTSVAQPES